MLQKRQKWVYTLLVAAVLTACGAEQPSYQQSPAPTAAEQAPRTAEKLGTKWGDEVKSSVSKVDLRRVSREPISENVLRYAAKNFQGRELNAIALADGKIEFSVRNDRGAVLPLVRDGGNYYLRGTSGEAYRLVYRNTTANTYEIVASVDGLDVLNGSAASRYHSGYVLRPHDTLTIEGFRKSSEAVASFIFSAPSSSYAAHSDNGSVRNVGLIGTAVFELYDPNAAAANAPSAFPADNGYAKPPK